MEKINIKRPLVKPVNYRNIFPNLGISIANLFYPRRGFRFESIAEFHSHIHEVEYTHLNLIESLMVSKLELESPQNFKRIIVSDKDSLNSIEFCPIIRTKQKSGLWEDSEKIKEWDIVNIAFRYEGPSNFSLKDYCHLDSIEKRGEGFYYAKRKERIDGLVSSVG